MQTGALPDSPGTYILVFLLAEPLALTVGRLGAVVLEPGTYAYVGSAGGPGGLRARVQRHLRRGKPLHWHIDTVTVVLPVDQVWMAACDVRLECATVRRLLAQPGAAPAAAGFGSSDCREHCPAHLVHLPGDAAQVLANLGPEWSMADDA
jgi:Uri superfamily endonuclease